MTEEQFIVYGREIVQDDECWAVAYSEYNADVIATALNQLNDEKETLVEVVKRANNLISRFGSDELKHQWKKAVTIEYVM